MSTKGLCQMLPWLLPFFSTLVVPSFAHSVPFHNQRLCGVEDPSTDLVDTHRYLHHNEPLDNNLWNATHLLQRISQHGNLSHAYLHSKRQATNPYYTIDTYIHVVSDAADSSPSSPNYVTDAMISNQFTYLAQAYTQASIGFRLRGITRTTNDTWASNGDDQAMKTALRRGTYRTLNIYYQSDLQAAPGTPGIPAGSTLLGYCSLPAAGVTTTTSPSVYVLDGCNVLSGTMPAGTFTGYNIGGTTAHEVGHWNGLLHTFQDNTCDPSDYGDYVADTPQEMTSTNGCPSTKDTCPNSGITPNSNTLPSAYGPSGYSGPDPVHNFMDYSSDACYTGFTPGQGARMLNIWQIYRMGL